MYYLLEETISGKCILHHGYMKKIGWYETFVKFYHNHTLKKLLIYQYHLNDGREKYWYETYIHFYHNHQHFIHNLWKEEWLIAWDLLPRLSPLPLLYAISNSGIFKNLPWSPGLWEDKWLVWELYPPPP